MDLDKAFQDEEKRLFNFIKSKVTERLEIFCHGEIFWFLREIIEGREQLAIKNLLYPMILEKLKQLAPLRYKNITNTHFFNPLDIIFQSPYSDSHYNQFHRLNYKNEIDLSCYITITYSEFNESHFNKIYCKKIIEKFIELDLIKRKKISFNGFSYTISNILECLNEVKFNRRGARFWEGSLEYFDDENWIYDSFPEEFILKKFEEIKTNLYNEFSKE